MTESRNDLEEQFEERAKELEERAKEWEELLNDLQEQRAENARLRRHIDHLKEQVAAQQAAPTTPTHPIKMSTRTHSKKMCTTCTTIDCRGMRCRISHNDGASVHCKACYAEEHENTPIILSAMFPRTRAIVQCRGQRCRLNNAAVYCESCFGPDK